MKNSFNLALICIGAALVLNACSSNSNQKENPKKIEVTGSAEMEVVPNQIYMTFNLKEYLDANKQKVKLESIKAEFLKLCKTVGIVDSNISISGYSGSERWDYYWYKKRKSEPDFMGTISYTIKVNVSEKLDQLVNEINDKALDYFNITKTSHSDMEQLRKDVKTKALIASKAKADYLAKSIGEELGEALLIQEIESNDYGYNSNALLSNSTSYYKESDNNEVASSPNFEKIKIRYEMRAEFKLK